jgi:hypothetical protein
MDTIQMLYTIMVDEMGLSNSDTLVDPKRSISIQLVLNSRQGSPIILGIICKSILSRVGITVDIVPDPRCVLLSVPGRGHVDFMNCCRTLSNEVRTGHMAESPITVAEGELQVLYFLMDSLLSYCQRVMHVLRSTRSFNATKRAEFLQTFMIARTTLQSTAKNAYNECSAHDAQYLDPEIFRKYNLINDSTMHRHDEAPWHTQQEPGW